MNFQAALFDMDGLLLDTEALTIDCMQETARAFDLPDLSETFIGMVGLRSDLAMAVLKGGLNGAMDAEAFTADAGARIAERRTHGIPVKPGVRELLQILRAQGTPCALATSSRTETAESYLAQTGLNRFFDTLTGGDRVMHAKPHPEIYLTAAASIGIDPKKTVAFEDSEPGVRAAHAARACVVQVPDLIAPSDDLRALCHHIAPDVLSGARAVGLIG